jgi:hypothetical protein
LSFRRGLNAAFYAVKIYPPVNSPRGKTVGHGFYVRALVAVGEGPAVLLPQMGGSPAGALGATYSNGPTIFSGHALNMARSGVSANGPQAVAATCYNQTDPLPNCTTGTAPIWRASSASLSRPTATRSRRRCGAGRNCWRSSTGHLRDAVPYKAIAARNEPKPCKRCRMRETSIPFRTGSASASAK